MTKVQEPELVRVDLERIGADLAREGRKCGIRVDSAAFNKARMLVVLNMPLTIHTPPDRREQQKTADETDRCSNPRCADNICGRPLGDVWHCASCGFEGYCSEACRQQDEERHASSACKNSALERARHVPGTIKDALDAYFAPVARQLAEGLPRGCYYRPMCIQDMPEGQCTKRLANLEIWLSLQMLREAYLHLPKARDNKRLLCMSCMKPTALTVAAARCIVTDEQAARSIDADKMSPQDAEPLADIGKYIRLSFVGVTPHSCIYGRFRLCCDRACHAREQPKHGLCLFSMASNPVNGNVSLDLTYRAPFALADSLCSTQQLK